MGLQFSLRTLRGIGVATALAGFSTASFGQAANPLGVEWVGGNAADPAPAANTPLGVEWVGGDRNATKPASAPAANNPLGVDWVGGENSANGHSAAPAASNPLGVEWVGGDRKAAEPAPSPTSGVRTGGSSGSQPSSPAPQPTAPNQPSSPTPESPMPQPPATVQPAPEAPPAQSGSSRPGLAAALIDAWTYQAVAFSDGSGTISETRGVSGTLKFKPDGQYEQALYIGGIANVMKGSYRIVGGRLETTYVWRGESITDAFELYLDATGKRLTLAGLGSPKSHYTLQRVE